VPPPAAAYLKSLFIKLKARNRDNAEAPFVRLNLTTTENLQPNASQLVRKTFHR
jgi:hypothetical protein